LRQVRAATGFELGVRELLAVTEPPTPAELLLLREEIDPYRYVIGRG
jgi:glutaconate CoA-transferase subunit B